MRSKSDIIRGRAFAAAVLVLAVALALLSVGGGCGAPPRVGEPLTQSLGGSDPEQQMDFWHGLTDRPLACNDEAFHALLLYLDGADPADSYDGRVAVLKDRGLIPAAFDRPGDEAVERGTVAVALLRSLAVERGWVTGLFGASPRYAVRELQYVNVFPPSSPQQLFTGNELVGIIGRAEDYRRSTAAAPGSAAGFVPEAPPGDGGAGAAAQ